MKKRFQDTKGLIDGHIVQWPTEKGKTKNNDRHKTTQQTKDGIPNNNGANSSAPEGFYSSI
jgi:hypothetical protein